MRARHLESLSQLGISKRGDGTHRLDDDIVNKCLDRLRGKNGFDTDPHFALVVHAACIEGSADRFECKSVILNGRLEHEFVIKVRRLNEVLVDVVLGGPGEASVGTDLDEPAVVLVARQMAKRMRETDAWKKHLRT